MRCLREKELNKKYLCSAAIQGVVVDAAFDVAVDAFVARVVVDIYSKK